MATEAVNEAKVNYEKSGGSVTDAKVVIVMENVGDTSNILQTKIRSIFGATIPIVGVQNAWADYTPYTLKSIPPESSTKSLALMVLGGSAISVSYATGIADFASNSTSEAVKGGINLAEKLKPQNNMNNLILLMGQMHTPLNEYVISGIKQKYGNPLPNNVKIIGWSGAYWGGSIYDNGTLKTNQIIGIMVSGDYTWAFRGIDHGRTGWDSVSGPDEGNPVSGIVKAYTDITTELHQKPSASFMVIAHPDRTLFTSIRNNIETTMGQIAMIGQHGGSETGHDSTSGDVIADVSHFFLAGIALSTTTVMPTSSMKPGDANNDNRVNGADYIIWLSHYSTTAVNGNSTGDFNADGKVNGLDYIVWLNHYGL